MLRRSLIIALLGLLGGIFADASQAQNIGGPAAGAQNMINPYVGVRVEHDNNIYRVQNSQAALLQYGDPTLGDTDFHYIAGVDGTYLWGLQKLTGKLEFSREDYDHFTHLDHNEYLGRLDFDWRLTTLIDGTFEFQQRRYQAPFADRDSTQLEIDTERNIVGKFNALINPNWRVETTLRSYNLEAPLQLYPDYIERDTEEDVGVKYLGTANLTYGLMFGRVQGKFENAPNVAPYTQSNVNLNLQYVVSALTSLNGAVGYTHRDQGGGLDSVSAVTGDIAYNRQLTAKTSVKLEVVRAVNSYVAAGGSEIDSTGTAAVTWQATYKLAVAAGYSYTHSTFIGQAIAGAVANDRVDNSPSAQVDINYQFFRRLLVHAYYHQQDRHSNLAEVTYSDSVEGIEIIGHWR